MYGHKQTAEARKKISDARRGKIYGPRKELHELKDLGHKHEWIRRKYGKGYCEICGMHEKMHLFMYSHRLSMHCRSFPKNYDLDIPENWMTMCHPCHSAYEASIDNFQPNVFFYDY